MCKAGSLYRQLSRALFLEGPDHNVVLESDPGSRFQMPTPNHRHVTPKNELCRGSQRPGSRTRGRRVMSSNPVSLKTSRAERTDAR
ncbi:hypothetical protein TNCV_2117491 [Trichonephila clavipes]|nr:hypothetical protein TNCV_2117491 [Trichonephila clavipes]